MGQFLGSIQYRLKNSSSGFVLLMARLFIGAFLGLTASLVFERVFGFGDLAFALIIVMTSLLFVKLTSSWKLTTLLVFSLFCVLIGLLLKMYIMVAPG